jgi:hypothetical protein
MVELRSADGEVLSIDYGHTPPNVERGRAVLLEDLQLQGLKDESAKDEKGRQFNCPHCGAPVQVQLATTKSLTCGSCNSIISLNSGVGGELRRPSRTSPCSPSSRWAAKGQLQGVHWQVVGFQHRMGVEPGDDEHFGWSEYLLYNQKRGFAFLVDSEEGWSMVRPTTGAPQLAANGRSATYWAPPTSSNTLRGRNHLRAGRVLLAGRARPENQQPRLRRQPFTADAVAFHNPNQGQGHEPVCQLHRPTPSRHG